MHNGVNSVEAELGTNQFFRLRIGIENRGELKNKISGADYVLGKFENRRGKDSKGNF